jgi:ubiquinone/menaquinone biosynthesis C-methylase UbiE
MTTTPHSLRPIRARLNAWLFSALDGLMHRHYGARKARLFGSLPQTVVELGPGCGANFRYLQPGIRVIAVEPNLHMHPALRASARKRGLELELSGDVSRGLTAPDESVSAVIATLVLCSVAEPAALLREVRRVLQPEGRFICIEHVAANPHSFIGRVQRLFFRPWRWFFEGCHTHRDTAQVLEGAGFSRVEIERFSVPTLFLPIRPHIAVVATK